MKLKYLARLVVVGLAALAELASAASYDLATDFSSTSNPNGVWSYMKGGVPITQSLPSTFLGGSSGWGYSSNLDGSVLHWSSPYNGSDIQPGDVTIHTVSNGAGPSVGVTFTSPFAGLYSISGKAWAAGFNSDRNANWTLSVGGQFVAKNEGGVYGISSNSAAAQFSQYCLPGMSLSSIYMTAGEQIAFLTQTTTYFGHFMGVDITVSSIPVTAQVPEPASMLLIGSGLAGLVVLKRRKK